MAQAESITSKPFDLSQRRDMKDTRRAEPHVESKIAELLDQRSVRSKLADLVGERNDESVTFGSGHDNVASAEGGGERHAWRTQKRKGNQRHRSTLTATTD